MDKGLAHSHIHGLGVDRGMNIVKGAGLFGMENARKAASIFCDMVSAKKTAGKALLITGESGSGKTALAVGISKELGTKVPFVKMSGSEVFSAEVRKTEILQQAARRAVSIRVREIKRVYEGEIINLRIEEKEDRLNNYRKSISHVHLSLKSGKGSQKLTLSPSLSQEIVKQRISVGDIVYVEADDCIIKKIGRSEAYASEFDIESDKYVPMPKGEIFTKKEVLQEMTLHEIDVANTKPKGEDVVSLINQVSTTGKLEITQKLRNEVDAKISAQLNAGAAEITPGVLFIDESHILDVECYAFLGTLLESPSCPVLVFATNKQVCKVAGSSDQGLFGMPEDFLSRVMITKIPPLTPTDIDDIVSEKIRYEQTPIEAAGAKHLSSIAQSTSLRYAFGLLPIALVYSRGPITQQSLEDISTLFPVDE
ncbi:RuvB-like protein 1 (pontin 52) [Nematocida displodere]|uniref:RuvB-like helicase n=1 Tax=Nematocida displodere TaxID=1805483 RepID=A0A177EF91_9MICR|nr:RuvB-like protein 1 (pontin 52) [Nematocida displodere]